MTFVSTVKLLCWAISGPRSQVNERRKDAGSLRTGWLRAATTVVVSLLDTLGPLRHPDEQQQGWHARYSGQKKEVYPTELLNELPA